jgi:5'(3')-deoxyribonucleotidase
MKNKIVAVDVDLTFVDSLTPWLAWFTEQTGETIKNEDGAYDLVPEMKAIIARKGLDFDPFAFWLKKDLYDDLRPLKDAVDVLNETRAAGAKIIFVSLCEPEHLRSKDAFIRRFMRKNYDGFISTGEKHFVGYDVLIDDREKHHELGMLHRPNSTHLLFNGVLRTTTKRVIPSHFNVVDNWIQVDDYFTSKPWSQV